MSMLITTPVHSYRLHMQHEEATSLMIISTHAPVYLSKVSHLPGYQQVGLNLFLTVLLAPIVHLFMAPQVNRVKVYHALRIEDMDHQAHSSTEQRQEKGNIRDCHSFTSRKVEQRYQGFCSN